MRAGRLVAGAVARWTALALAGTGALAGLATAVEAGSAWRVPGLVLPLLPVVCALGAGLAAARLEARGERQALEACGLSPARTGRAALLVGLLVGALGFGLHAGVVPWAEARAPEEAPAWVWVDDGALRPGDGTAVHIADDAIVGVEAGVALPPERLRRAVARQRPATAALADLWGAPGVPARAERAARLARVLACGLLAWLAWLPLARRPADQAAAAVALGLAQAGLDGVLRAAAAQGRLPVAVGAWGAVLLVALVLAGAVVAGRYRTLSQ